MERNARARLMGGLLCAAAATSMILTGCAKTWRIPEGGEQQFRRDAFACDEQSFNLLYLVSSAPPAFAEDLLKRCQRLGIPLVWNQNGVAYAAWAGSDVER